MVKKKLLRLTTIDLSLDKLIRGQLKFLSQYFEVVGVASNTGLLHGVAKREGIRTIDVPMHREISLVNDVKSLWHLYRVMKQEKPDILHCNTPKGSLLGLMAGKLAGVPNRVYTVTGLRYQGVSGVFRTLLMTMERISCYCATKVIPEGQGVLKTLQQDHITSKPLKVLHYGNINGVDTTFFSREAVAASPVTRAILGLKIDDFVFVFVGRIVKDKGINELAHCIQKLDCKVILVGSFDNDDPIDPELKEFLQSSDKVKCVGWQEDVRPYLAIADALVFPSYREGFPNAPMQAGAYDLPCIVTDVNGCNEIIEDGVNGKIIPAPLEEGSEKMEAALLEVMQWFIDNPSEVKQMSRKARGMIVERYEQKAVWEALLKEYNLLLNKESN